jgi:DivIVA domain-containing protein
VERDDQSSERRHFPPVREGYDRVAVDAYLGDLAAEVAALTRISGELHERAQALGGELKELTASLRAGVAEPPVKADAEVRAKAGVEPTVVAAQETAPIAPSSERSQAIPAAQAPLPPPAARSEQQRSLEIPAAAAPPSPPPARGEEDLDGARLVALNMALSGESREQTDRYLADSFQLSDRAKLLDEVYAAIEG